jgi:hypothetical protein
MRQSCVTSVASTEFEVTIDFLLDWLSVRNNFKIVVSRDADYANIFREPAAC